MNEHAAWSRPLPTPTPLSAPFWEATRRGVLRLQHCAACDVYEWTPQQVCSRCLRDSLSWTDVSGRGSVYSFSVVHRPQTPGFTAPYVVAIVELEEGPRMLTDLVEVAPDAVRIDMPVEIAFENMGELALYHFRPRAQAQP